MAKISTEVLSVLSLAEVTGNELKLVGVIDRKLYVKVNEVIEAAGGKWNRKLKSHVFEGDSAERIDELITTGEFDRPKNEFNFFPTPVCVVDRLIELARIEQGMLVLEPSAGIGNIALACCDVGAIVDCVELMSANVITLDDANMYRYIYHKDFLNTTLEDLDRYDRIVMNPPFAKQADIKHVTHALQFLKPDGFLVSVMSAGVTFRQDKRTKEFVELISSVEELPEGSFKESGTSVNTVIVTIQK